MTEVDIFSGFLGAGKTTLIKKLIADGYNGQKLVIIDNEFGQIGIDSGFLKDSGIQITEMNSGCICCSLVGDFRTALSEVISTYAPDRIVIEPSGVGKLSDVVAAVNQCDYAHVRGTVAVVDATKLKIYLRNFKEFYENQIESAGTIILSRTEAIKQDKLDEAIELIKGINKHAQIITTPLEQLSGKQIIDAIENPQFAEDMAKELLKEQDHCDFEHQHHNHEHSEGCTCGCHDHDHHHEEHHDHHHHHADEVFDSVGFETTHKYTKDSVETILNAFDEDEKFGVILRAKGIVASEKGGWIHFDYGPGESSVRSGVADVTGKICVIGTEVNKEMLAKLFEI